jgi:precorrin-2 dehydrogenase/sirohydrochlorin ferrochelatase
VGGGNVGLEKLSLLKSSPNAIVEVVAPRFFELETLAASHGSVKLTYKSSIAGCFVNATWSLYDDLKVNKRIMICPEKILICNIADTPPLCDYYLGELSQRPCENCDFDQRKITYNCQAIARVF